MACEAAHGEAYSQLFTDGIMHHFCYTRLIGRVAGQSGQAGQRPQIRRWSAGVAFGPAGRREACVLTVENLLK